ncbi:AraC-like DNA-binding protein [Antricoccus suffuscus]|uniref:AraC-like DNA-binding protein n=1 Tax=Antricoccus suffuscus TaxID=1629062 RepID=A0A2T0YZH7_9ACTN|nr:helix-turn-helix transcriptional regulator [Antricoccus suffuscus]PRZ29506.1 AraC-like DNA-binding protein [Antricoccus suffuscus]
MRNVAVEAARFLAMHADQQITLHDVADHVSYSPFHLARSFERVIGVPPGHYLASQRFQRAKQILLTCDDSVLDVCYAVGFNSVGTFTSRFRSAVGVTPTQFRRLPDQIGSPVRPIRIIGPAGRGAVVSGAIRMSSAAVALAGARPSIYVGLFARRDPRGVPVAGALLTGTTDYVLTGVPSGTFWVLASALSTHADSHAQLVPKQTVSGGAPQPIHAGPDNLAHRRDLFLDIAADWAAPVLVALPALATAGAQDRRRQA